MPNKFWKILLVVITIGAGRGRAARGPAPRAPLAQSRRCGRSPDPLGSAARIPRRAGLHMHGHDKRQGRGRALPGQKQKSASVVLVCTSVHILQGGVRNGGSYAG